MLLNIFLKLKVKSSVPEIYTFHNQTVTSAKATSTLAFQWWQIFIVVFKSLLSPSLFQEG